MIHIKNRNLTMRFKERHKYNPFYVPVICINLSGKKIKYNQMLIFDCLKRTVILLDYVNTQCVHLGTSTFCNALPLR